jgi:hypothetical protein
MQDTYQYFAFISFQNADAREAVRLQHAIESYRLPAVLCRQNSVPRRIRPLYCYINDMHAGEELMQELKQRMENSRFLIVVCSPRSAKSVYVNSGIEYFISLGRRDSIIPIIIDGVPYSSDPETECFPEALRRHFPKHADPLQDHSILGINVREAGVSRRQAYDRAMLMVVARMLQLDFDGLLLREKQRRRRRAIGWTLLSLVIACALGCTWYLSQSVAVSVIPYEASPHNDYLPPASHVTVSLSLENESKTDSLTALGDTLLFRNIPPRYIGREVRLCVTADGYIPCDTNMVLQKRNRLPMLRNPEIYGHVHFRLIGKPQRLSVAGRTVLPDKDSRVDISFPVAEQRKAYPVEWQGGADSVYMPCGGDDVIITEP